MTEIFPPYFHSYGESYEDRPVGGGGGGGIVFKMIR